MFIERIDVIFLTRWDKSEQIKGNVLLNVLSKTHNQLLTLEQKRL